VELSIQNSQILGRMLLLGGILNMGYVSMRLILLRVVTMRQRSGMQTTL
jgi:hypothetical protein